MKNPESGAEVPEDFEPNIATADVDNDDSDEPETEEKALERQHAHVLCPLREKHRKIAFWHLEEHGLVVAAKPGNPKTYHNLINQLRNDKADTAVTLENFALACVVHPAREAAKAIFRDLPAFAAIVATKGQTLCGSDVKELGKA